MVERTVASFPAPGSAASGDRTASGVSVPAVLAVLRRRWVILAVGLLVGLLLSGYLSATSPERYRSTSRLFVNIPAARGVQEALQGVQLSSQLMSSYARVATSREAARRVSDRLEGQFTPGEVRSRIDAQPVPETLLLDVVATDAEPGSARDLANAAAAVLIEFITELEQGKVGAVEARVVDQAALPSSPMGPGLSTYLMLGGFVGAAVGLLAALTREALDRSITAGPDAVRAFGAPLLATIPRSRQLGRRPLIVAADPSAAASEAFRSLRTAIRFVDRAQSVRTVLVSSPLEGEGKTTVAANLALAFAQAGERVTFVDADLRRPRVAVHFGLAEGMPGLTSVLTHRVDLQAALVRAAERLMVLPSGPVPPNPSELVGTEAMAALVDDLAAGADVVVIDAPPVLPVTDASVLAAWVDGVVLVARSGATPETGAEEASESIDRVGGNLIGCVLNRVPANGRGYYRRRYSRRPGAVKSA